ncbi:hypothetical protein [Candidatus Nitrosocosmicus franklandus]|uniref:PsbP C-terminal domain-containing protein n=1 Tax=Candidatus Nitrosocosmicus franklandianus TaxID=1798806 RepID=A0A484IC85_9ARCH|nr:hypothetical protein [Candidatus Nitrosocosmicus franklandus]VFJ12631.1 protein of unknown function [Candidatus Nitrosocosmicus franklandus]
MKLASFILTLVLIWVFTIPIFGQSFAQVTWNTFEEENGLFSVQVPSNWNVSEISGAEALAPIDYIFHYNDKGNSFAWIELMISEPFYTNSSAVLDSFMSQYQQYDDFVLLEPITCDKYTLNDEPACSFLSSQHLEGELRRNVLDIVSISPNGTQTYVVFVASNNIYEPFLPVAEYVVDSISINSTMARLLLENISLENIQTEIPDVLTNVGNQSQTFSSAFDTFVNADPQGYGVYDQRNSSTFSPGEDIILYIEPVGFEYGTTGEGSDSIRLTFLQILSFLIQKEMS